MAEISKFAEAIRAMRARYLKGAREKHAPVIYISCRDAKAAALIDAQRETINVLARSSKSPPVAELHLTKKEEVPRGCATDVLDASTEVHIYLKGVVDFGGEIKRLQKERGLVAGRLDKLVKKTEAKDYATKCPAATQEEDRTKVAEMNGEIASLDAAIAAFQAGAD